MRCSIGVDYGVRELRATKLAEVALERYDFGDAQLHILRQGFVQVFRVVSPTWGNFVLRMYDTPLIGEEVLHSESYLCTGSKLRSPRVLHSQLLWLSALGRETGLLVPEPVPMSDGALMRYVSFDDLPLHRQFLRRVWRRYRATYHPAHPGRYCVLLRWVPGEHKRGDELNLEEFSLLGSYIARLHRHGEGYSISDGALFPHWGWEWPFGESVPLWNEGAAFYSPSEMAVFEETARRVHKDLEKLGYSSDVFGLIHRDLNLNNVVFDGRRVGAIDFDMCGLGHYLLDLTVQLHGLRLHYPDRFGPMRKALFEGYESVRRLPQNYNAFLKTFAAMLRVASTNRDLELLASEATRHQSRGQGFLRNTVRWLKNNYLRDGE